MARVIGIAKGVTMYNWQIEFLAEDHRRELVHEMEQIRLEKLALKSRLYRPGLFERTMFNFANWMISTGKQLRKRYEIPTVHCNHPPTGSFVR
jgi:hypothetical protein